MAAGVSSVAVRALRVALPRVPPLPRRGCSPRPSHASFQQPLSTSTHRCNSTQTRGSTQVIHARGRGSRLSSEMEELQAEEKQFAPDVTKLEWKSPLTLDSIVKYPSPVLRAPNGRVATFGDDLKQLAAEMFEVMYQDDGVGLAAPQVGVNVRLMVFNPEGVRGSGREYVLANPRIISTSNTTERGEEGCLSFITDKGLILGDVDRATMVKIKAQDENGAKFQLKLEGWTARIFQHEFDHLQGKLFVDADRMIAEDRAAAAEELQKLEAEFAALHPGVEAESVVS
eukprot:CAMPEP_0177777364 /NCGR_PEP_ID=MMETSP0491_2-20121128/15315_1 /TAXON_ID=63592 /ORGANISM="Tetraselmis chuii, Strain PLY429" /LENGTH=284 /DNA_ID=CAMNT_0019296433 /DNA_START=136 /DNA_END=990 /DNA_ORIENTATION=-